MYFFNTIGNLCHYNGNFRSHINAITFVVSTDMEMQVACCSNRSMFLSNDRLKFNQFFWYWFSANPVSSKPDN